MLAVDAEQELLVQGARAGEPDAWDQLFQRYQLPLYAYVFEWVHHEQTSLDIVQETFINAVRHLDSLRHDAKFGSWLFSIAHQKCTQHWRRQNRQERVLDLQAEPPEDFHSPDADPGAILIRKEQEEEFMALLGRLPAAHRSVLLLHFVEDFSLEEIAAITGTPVGTVKSRLHYGKQTLRHLIKEET